jgi:hypothetical protein
MVAAALLLAPFDSAPAQTNTGVTAKAAAGSESPGIPRFDLGSALFDFGRIKQGEVVKHDFVFTNTGTAILEITSVKPGCGCTTAGTWDSKVEPGKTGSIPLQFNSSGFGGPVSKSATVTCNDPIRSNLVLQLSGTIWKPIDITPTMAVFNVPGEGQTNETKVVRIVSNVEEPIEISDLRSSQGSIKPELKTLKSGKEFELHLTATPPFEASLMAQISMKTSSTQAPALTVTAYVNTAPVITVMPPQMVVAPGQSTNPAVSPVVIRNNGTNALVLSDAQVNIPGAEAHVQEVEPGRRFNLSVTLPPGFDIPPGQFVQVALKSNHPRYPLIKVPVIRSQPSTPGPVPPASPERISTTKRIVPTRVAAPVTSRQ